ncbi:hypothetical protein, partial [Klebsiella pneumoniae]|uniref:hypothetical protein n=1 Tax=Klebsiella pneumoniae TaxID=573 RepID=UPI0039C3D3C4
MRSKQNAINKINIKNKKIIIKNNYQQNKSNVKKPQKIVNRINQDQDKNYQDIIHKILIKNIK